MFSQIRIRPAVCLLAGLIACGSLVDVDNPGVIESDRLDPERDGRVFSLSARQDFSVALGGFVLGNAWFTGEAISAETMAWPSEFERRDLHGDNAGLLSIWSQLSAARASAERVVTGLRNTAGADANLDLARAALFAGYAYVHMAEAFCTGAVDAGPLLSTIDLLRRATDLFTIASDAAAAASNLPPVSSQSEARSITLAARVGRARASLQQGLREAALADAQSIAAGFQFDVWYSDDASNPGRLANVVWFNTASRGVLSVAPAFRDLQDPRVPVMVPVSAFPPFDGVTPLWTQRKYVSSAASIRLASGLEAQYIAAEAQASTSSMLTFIQQRRAAGGQSSYSGSADLSALTRELLEQRSRDFFLEGKRMGDSRRHPGLLRGFPQTGDAYHKPGFAPIGSQTCWPLPDKETARFP
jgi:starch-binding outer membrane protein, SusD/RagB family